jgi:hypothetical protein
MAMPMINLEKFALDEILYILSILEIDAIIQNDVVL